VSRHDSDSFSISYDELANVLVHRKDVTDATKPPLTFELKKFEVITLIKSLADDADYRQEMIAYLSNEGFIRPNHDL
jgi:hypothetical protein